MSLQNLEKRSGLDRGDVDDNFSDCTSVSTKTESDRDLGVSLPTETNTLQANQSNSPRKSGSSSPQHSSHNLPHTSSSSNASTSALSPSSVHSSTSFSSSSSAIAYYDEGDKLLWHLVRFTSLALTTSKKEQRVNIMLSLALHWAAAVLLCNSRPHDYSSISPMSLLARLSDLQVLNVPQLARASNLRNLTFIFPKFSPAFEFIFSYPTPLLFAVSLVRVTQSPLSVRVISILSRAQPGTCFETDTSDNTPIALVCASNPIATKGELPISSSGFLVQESNLSITSLLIQELTSVAPLTHMVTNCDGLLPVHIAASYSSVDTLLSVLAIAPNCVYAMATPSSSSPLSVRVAPNSSPFHFFVARNDQPLSTENISKIISLHPQYLGMVDGWGRTPLIVALQCGCTDSDVLSYLAQTVPPASQNMSSKRLHSSISPIPIDPLACAAEVLTSIASDMKREIASKPVPPFEDILYSNKRSKILP